MCAREGDAKHKLDSRIRPHNLYYPIATTDLTWHTVPHDPTPSPSLRIADQAGQKANYTHTAACSMGVRSFVLLYLLRCVLYIRMYVCTFGGVGFSPGK